MPASCAGTCTAAIDALQCGWSVIVVEKDPICFQLALEWPQNFAKIVRNEMQSSHMFAIAPTICGK